MDETDVTVRGPNLIFPSGKIIRLDFGVEVLLDFGDVVVVCLDVPPYVPYDENVVGISKDGNVLWRIRPQKNGKGEPVGTRYVGGHRDGKFAAVNAWEGFIYYLDPYTGEVDHSEFTK